MKAYFLGGFIGVLVGFAYFLSLVGTRQAAAQTPAPQPAPAVQAEYQPSYVSNVSQLIAYIDPGHLYEVIGRHKDRNVLIVVKDGDKWLVVFGPQQ